MSAVLTKDEFQEPMTLDVSQTRNPPFLRLVGVELRKSYDTRSGFWLLMSMGILAVITLAIMTIVGVVNDNVEFAYEDFVAAIAFVTSVLLPVLGILLVTSEWSQRTGMTTFALSPHRLRVIMAKMVAGLAWTFVIIAFALVVGAVVNLLYGAMEGEMAWRFGWEGLTGFVITQSLAMLGGFALATLLLNSPAAIVAFFAYKWILPTLFAIGAALIGWFEDLLPWIDFQTAQGPLYEMTNMDGEDFAHLLVSGAFWLGLPLAIGIWRVLRAEVK
ncbi:ABC transporter permease [Nocardioides speluncae]|uniref:ABC transporter permease n=1 Tax=Nocardioides speluncae TaxID=2670337 RepID=UPI001F0B9D3F|nr:ABC transporter permease [Nocardioides speluncae]